MNIALDEVMKMETKNADTKELLKKIKYMQIYSFENLNDKYRKKYDILKESNLNTARAYAIKENLRNLRRSGACNRPFKFTHFRPLKSIQKRPLNIYHLMQFHAGDGKCAKSGGLAYD